MLTSPVGGGTLGANLDEGGALLYTGAKVGDEGEMGGLLDNGGGQGGKAKCTVWQGTCLIVAAVVGLGIMALPASLARLGWGPGLVALLSMWAVNLYTGLVLFRLRVAIPHGISYTHLGAELLGTHGGTVCRVISMLQLFMIEAEYLLVNTESLAAVTYEISWCRPTWGVLMGALLLPFVQLRTLHHVSFLSAVSAVSVFLVLLFCLHEMATNGPSPAPLTELIVESGGGVLNTFHSLSSMVFACGSQFVYLEVMDELKSVKSFPSSMYLSGAFILGSYTAISVAGYYTYGTDVKAYIVDIIPNGPKRRVVNFLMLVHTMVSYILMSQVLCTSLLQLPGLRTASYSQRLHKLPSAVPGREEWFVTSMLVLIVSYTVSNIIPFFDELTVIIGSLIGGLISFGLPATFILKADAQGKATLSETERMFLYTLLVFTGLLMILGLLSGVVELLIKWDTLGYPFECHCIGAHCGELELRRD